MHQLQSLLMLVIILAPFLQVFMAPSSILAADDNSESGSLIISDKVINNPEDLSVSVSGPLEDQTKRVDLDSSEEKSTYDGTVQNVEGTVYSKYVTGAGKTALIFPAQGNAGSGAQPTANYFKNTIISVSYPKVGYLRQSNGTLTPLSATLTISDITRAGEKWRNSTDISPVIDFSSNLYSGIYIGGLSSLKIKFEFFDDKGNAVNFNQYANPYITFNSLNGYGNRNYRGQMINGEFVASIDGASAKTIGTGSILEQATVKTSSENLLPTVSYPNVWTATQDDGTDSNDDISDPLFNKRSVQFSLAGTSNTFLLGTGGGAGFTGWFTFASSAITPTRQTSPVKTVQPTTETGEAAWNQRFYNDLDIFDNVSNPWEMPEEYRVAGHNPDVGDTATGVLPKANRFVKAGDDYSYFINQPTINLASEGLVQPKTYTLTDTLPKGVALSNAADRFTLYNLDGSEIPLTSDQVKIETKDDQTTITLALTADQSAKINAQSTSNYGGDFSLQIKAHATGTVSNRMINQARSTFTYENGVAFDATSNRVETRLNDSMTLTFQKVDADDPTIGLSGARFAVYSQSDNKTVIATGVSKNGRVTMSPELKPGNYRLVETDAPTGYTADFSKDFTVTKQSDGSYKAVVDDTKETIDSDYKVKNQLTPIKVSFHKVDENNQPLAGAKFALYKTPKGEDDIALSTATSEADGTVSFDQALAAGDYQIVETDAPAGYAKLTQPIKFSVKRGENGLKAVMADNSSLADYEAKNDLKPLTLTFQKVDGKGQALQNAQFEIRQDDKTIGTATSDEKGNVTFGESLSVGNYQLVETKAPDGFDAHAPISFEVKKGKQGLVAVLDKDSTTEINNKYKVVNTLKPVDLLLNKVDLWSGKQLSGAEFTLTDQSDKTNVIHSKANDRADANLIFEGLKPGEYTLAETKAPDGYILSETTRTVVVTAQGAVTVNGNKQNVDLSGDDILAGVVTVKNTPDTILPHTGGKGVNFLLGMAMTLLGMAVILASITWLRRREVRDHA